MTRDKKETELTARVRHDPCVAPRCISLNDMVASFRDLLLLQLLFFKKFFYNNILLQLPLLKDD